MNMHQVQQLKADVTQLQDRQNATDKNLVMKLDRFFTVLVVVVAMSVMHLYAIDTRLDAIDVRLDTIDTRLDAIDVRLDTIDVRLDAIDAQIKAIHAMLAQQLQLLTVLVQTRI